MPVGPASEPAEIAGRARVRDLFLRLLGVIFLFAFFSLLVQVTLLVGERGLLPAAPHLAALPSFFSAPTVFWFGASDAALRIGAWAGIALSLGLTLNLAPRYCLAAIWVLYLSFVNVGQEFLAFQWDNLLLETAALSLFIAPGGLRPGNACAPHPVAVFLMLWLVFRLHFESGAAKLLLGDPTWRDLTAMATYYETAPLPTWGGWYAHQMPLWAHRVTSAFVYVVELGLPLLIWGPRHVRAAVAAIMLAMQLGIGFTANYGIFNHLSAALCLFVLDDRHLGWLAWRCGWTLPPTIAPARSPRRTVFLGAVAAALVTASLVQFLPFVPVLRNLDRELVPMRRVLDRFRSVNAYHLFAQMTLVRREVVIEASDDGSTWQAYEFRYKPGDPERPPPFVAPHQPRVDFLLWFLTLGRNWGARYFDALLARLMADPPAVAPLFTVNPFPVRPPKFLRVAYYRYRFTKPGDTAWWQRELLGYSRVLGGR